MRNNEFKKQLIQRTYKYGLDIIKLIDSLDKKDYSVQVIVKQLLKSATSIGANIIEAQAASSRRDFVNFLTYALNQPTKVNFGWDF